MIKSILNVLAKFLLLSMVLTASVYVVERVRGNRVDSRLEIVYNELKEVYKAACEKEPPLHTVEIKPISGAKGKIVAYCSYGLFRNTITIDEEIFQTRSESYITTLLAHEMAHCFMYMNHKQEEYSYLHKTPKENPLLIFVYLEFFKDAVKVCN